MYYLNFKTSIIVSSCLDVYCVSKNLNYDVQGATFMSKPSWKNQLMRELMVDSLFHSGMKYSDKKGGKYCHFLSKL
jgi:hypothetical protein